MKTKALFNRREGISLFILVFLAIATLTFIFWKSNSQLHQTPLSTKDWVTYSDQDIPFSFDHPKDWSISKDKKEYSVILTASDKNTKEAMLSIRYQKRIPGGITDGASVCHGRNPRCDYISSSLATFSRPKNDPTWTGYISRDRIFITLIKQDENSEKQLIEIIESIRS